MKMIDLLNSFGPLQVLSQEKVNGKIAYKIAKDLRLVKQELDDYDTARLTICQKYGQLSDDKTQYIFDMEAQEKVDAEVDELVNTEVEIPILKLSLVEVDGLNVSGATLLALDWMIAE